MHGYCRVEVDGSRKREDGGKQKRRGSEGPSEGHRGADGGDEWGCVRDVKEKKRSEELSCLTNSDKKFR